MSQAQNYSPAELLALLPASDREAAIASLSEPQARQVLYDWRGFWARPNQITPPGDWLFWLLLAGRGFGKTRVGAETTREWAENPNERILMIAPTTADVRDVMVDGPSGILSCYPPERRPVYEPSKHLLKFPSGAIGITRSADEPERLRGPQFTKFWADEVCAWRFVQDAWDQLMFGFRLPGTKLQGVITTTPKPLPLIKELITSPETFVTRGSSYDNQGNLSEAFYKRVIKPYEGTRLGEQEIFAEILEDIEGALWKRVMIDSTRVRLADVRWDLLTRIVVAVDPAVTSTEESNETGIVVAALTVSQHVIVLDDLSCRETPLGWGRIAVNAMKSRRADRIIGEVNNGGDLVESNIRAVEPNAPYRAVRASRGKMRRAEPVAALYEQGRVHHVGVFPEMEEQMVSYVPGIDSRKSPDRMDALVWACTELLIDTAPQQTKILIGDPRSYSISPV